MKYSFFLWKLRRLRDSSKKHYTEGAKEIADDRNENTVCQVIKTIKNTNILSDLL